jgi:UTP--glucose-1-phosphate uridylyltransferase
VTIKKAVILAAGLGTRFLPVTKSMPKEMLPLIDKPVIHYVVKEAVVSGIDDIIIVTGRSKRAVEDYFDDSPELEMHLMKNGNEDLLGIVKEVSSLVDIHYIRQKEPLGLGDAILRAEKHIGDEPFAVLLGDDIVKNSVPCTKQLIEIFENNNNSVIGVKKVPEDKISRYGIIKGREIEDCLYYVEDIIEKPLIEAAPSNIAAVGRYVFTSEIFDCIKKTKPGIRNEIQLTDAIRILNLSKDIYASLFKGIRYDTGDRLGYVKAFIDFALESGDIGGFVLEYIREITKEREMTEILK